MHCIKLPEIIWESYSSIAVAIRTQRAPAPARMIDDYAWTLEYPTHLYLRAFRSYPRGG